MATITVPVDIYLTPTATGYRWDYSVNGKFTDLIVTIKPNDTADITMTIKLSGCVFQSPPLKFYRQKTGKEFIPQWYTSPAGGANTINFQDKNTNQHKQRYNFKIYVKYGQALLESPDPTIVNVGTDGIMFCFPEPGEPQLRPAHPETMAVAV